VGDSEKWLVTASARSDVPLLWLRLIVVAPTRQWLRRRQSVKWSTKSQWGAAWYQLCHALHSCKLVPAWDLRHGSRPGSSRRCLAATVGCNDLGVSWCSSWTVSRARWAGRYSAGTRRQQYGTWLPASVVSVARFFELFNFPRYCSNMPKVRWLMLYEFCSKFHSFPAV